MAVALLVREALKGVLGGLEDWLYSEEADDADLAELKEKRRQASVYGHTFRLVDVTLPLDIFAFSTPGLFGPSKEIP